MTVFCPYCGGENSDEDQLMDLLERRFWVLDCKHCGRDSGLVLYDLTEEKENV